MAALNLGQIEQKIYKAMDRAIEFEGVCFRNVSQEFANQQDIISSVGSKKYGGRFNLKGKFEVLYLSCDVHTCIEEVARSDQLSGFTVAKRFPRTTVGIEVKLSKVLDLTNGKTRRAISISKAVLTEIDWETIQANNEEAITQSIGRFAKNAGFEAILVPSAVWNGKNLDIFPDNLLPSSQILVVNRHKLSQK